MLKELLILGTKIILIEGYHLISGAYLPPSNAYLALVAALLFYFCCRMAVRYAIPCEVWATNKEDRIPLAWTIFYLIEPVELLVPSIAIISYTIICTLLAINEIKKRNKKLREEND